MFKNNFNEKLSYFKLNIKYNFMLKESKLKQEIKKAFDETLPTAFEQAFLLTYPEKSKIGSKIAKQFGEVINDLVSEPLAERLAAAIDYHVRSANVYGTIITTGSPVTQTAFVNSPSPLTNGKIPNTLGIM